jgi:hypothetical protein
VTICPTNPRLNQDMRIGIAYGIYEEVKDWHTIIHKTTRAGATTALLAESMNRGEKFCCIVPTNKIATETVIKESKLYSDLNDAEVVHIPANHRCILNQELIEEFPDLKLLPVLPLAGDCKKCINYPKCEVTAVLRNEDAHGVVLTYKKIVALMLAAKSREESFAGTVINVIHKSKNLILDEIHELQFGNVTSIIVYDDKVFNRINLDEYIPIMLDFPYLRRVISQFSLLISDNTVQNSIHEVFNGTQDKNYWKHHLNKSLSNPCDGIVEGEKEINVIVGTYSEIIELTKCRGKYNLGMNEILQLYSMMSIILSPVISINGIRDKGITEIRLSVVEKTFDSMIRSFVMSMQRPGKRIMLTSATICSFDYGSLFKANMQPRKITFGEGGDPLDTNAKMLILADSKRYHAIGRESRYNKEEEIVFKIRTILEIYGDSECMIITISQKEANKLMMALNKAGHSHPVTYYKAPGTMGVSAKERIMIAVGVANKPSNAYDVIKVALAHPAASNGVCSRHRSKFR